MMIAIDNRFGRRKDAKMELIGGLILVVMAIGAIVVGICGLAAIACYWWLAIPLLFAWVGGGFGFIFGIGLVVIIGLIVIAVNR